MDDPALVNILVKIISSSTVGFMSVWCSENVQFLATVYRGNCAECVVCCTQI